MPLKTEYVGKPDSGKQPASCPVCHGRGHHYFGFYLDEQANALFTAAARTTTPCRSCNGRGVIYA